MISVQEYKSLICHLATKIIVLLLKSSVSSRIIVWSLRRLNLFASAALRLVLLFPFVSNVRADSVITFNEVMYHPPLNEAQSEWVEICNQMAVMIDLTGWRITGGIEFSFATNTWIGPRSYLVVAIDPQFLRTNRGLTNVVGPFSGRLSNSDDEIELRSNTGRLMDSLFYQDTGEWPSAPDGTGHSLARIKGSGSTAAPENWISSPELGGSPGSANGGVPPDYVRSQLPLSPVRHILINEIMYHPRVVGEKSAERVRTTILPRSAFWRYHDGPQAPSRDWQAPSFDYSGWDSGAGLFYVSTEQFGWAKTTPLQLGPSAYYFRTDFVVTNSDPTVLHLRTFVDDGAVFYLNGKELYRLNMTTDAVTHATPALSRVADATMLDLTFDNVSLLQGTNVIAVEVHQHDPASSDVVFGLEVEIETELNSAAPAQRPPARWIEIHNAGTNEIDLSGWRIAGGVEFSFPAETMMPAGGYLIIAEDRDYLAALYTNIWIVGNFSKNLSRRKDLIRLVDLNGQLADEVRYFDNAPWPRDADGGGSSLELRNPFLNNSLPEAWQASVESAKSSWRLYQYSGTAGPNHSGTTYHELIVSLLDAGDVLLDDINVVENPRTAPVHLLQNGDFENGLAAWRFAGNHEGSVFEDPQDPGNRVLRLRSSGPATDLFNHAETTLKKGDSYAQIVPGREYEISFRAKWQSGANRLNTRLFFNRVAKTMVLESPVAGGTPGRRNSRYQRDTGPLLHTLSHQPAVPGPSQPITIAVQATDPEGVLNCNLRLWTRQNGWTNYSLTNISGDIYRITIPGFLAGTTAAYYIEASDNNDFVSFYPPPGSNAPCFLQVRGLEVAPRQVHSIRLIMDPAVAESLLDPAQMMSNERRNATLIYNEEEVFQNVGLRLKGAASSRAGSQAGYHIQFPADHLFRGVHRSIALDRNNLSEILTKYLNAAAGIPTMHNDAVYLFAPNPGRSGYAQLRMAGFGDVYLDSQFENGSDGTTYEKELTYMPSSTTGGPEGHKIANPYEHPPELNTDIANFGSDKEAYRWHWNIENNREWDDFTRIIDLNQIFSLPAMQLDAELSALIDEDQWLRTFAMVRLIGCRDFYSQPGGAPGSWNHNFIAYIRPSDRRVLALPWDLDESFQEPINGSIIGNMNLAKAITLPRNLRLYYGHYDDLIRSAYSQAYMTRWANHLGSILPGVDFHGPMNYIAARSSFVLSQLPKPIPFGVSLNSGPMTASGSARIEGTAPITIKYLRIAGVAPNPVITWRTITNWHEDLQLLLGTNSFQIAGYDFADRLVVSTNLAVTSTFAMGGLDSDVDKMPDRWESSVGLNPAVPDSGIDSDGDRLTNLDEYLAGTNPLDPASKLELKIGHANSITALMFQAQAGRTYSIERASEDFTWSEIANFSAAADSRGIAFQDESALPGTSFYRLALQIPR